MHSMHRLATRLLTSHVATHAVEATHHGLQHALLVTLVTAAAGRAS